MIDASLEKFANIASTAADVWCLLACPQGRRGWGKEEQWRRKKFKKQEYGGSVHTKRSQKAKCQIIHFVWLDWPLNWGNKILVKLLCPRFFPFKLINNHRWQYNVKAIPLILPHTSHTSIILFNWYVPWTLSYIVDVVLLTTWTHYTVPSLFYQRVNYAFVRWPNVLK